MAKQSKKQGSKLSEQPFDSVEIISQDQSEQPQAVSSEQHFATPPEETNTINESTYEEKIVTEENQVKVEAPPEIPPYAAEAIEKEKTKSNGKALSLLALLVALTVGGASYFFGQQKFTDLEQRLQQAQQQIDKIAHQGQQQSQPQTSVEIPTFATEKAQIEQLVSQQQKSTEQLSALATAQKNYTAQISQLQNQIQKLGSTPKAEPTMFLLSDADFLLTNALRKVVIDNDIDTAKSLLAEADKVLSQVKEGQFSKVREVREAIKADLNVLSNLNAVDQNNLMQRLAQLANLVDDMPMLENDQLMDTQNDGVSDSLADWQQNIEKSANSFLNRFIRVTDKKLAQDKAFIAPNQEIYLRENIRLRLQLAILAVPRQQNELYKQSLEAVSSWVRSYFDVQNNVVNNALSEIDELIEQSIYIDAPSHLQSLILLKEKLNRAIEPVEKIELEVDKAVEQLKIDTPKEQTPNSPSNNNQQ